MYSIYQRFSILKVWNGLIIIDSYILGLHIWIHGMENSSGKWILVDTVFQNEGILVDIFIGWILVEIFHEFSWTFIVHESSSFLVNFRGHFWGEF